jgi:hypothetical protein
MAGVLNRIAREFAVALNSVEPSRHSFDQNPVRYEYEAIAHEYRALREEVKGRIEKQQEITNFAVAFLAAVAVAGASLSSNGQLLLVVSPYFPLVPLILSAFALMTLDHEMNVAHMYGYIDNHLRPRLLAILRSIGAGDGDVWAWNDFRARHQQGNSRRVALSSPVAASKYGLTILPNAILSLILASIAFQSGRPMWASLGYLVPVLVLVVVVVIAIRVSLLYVSMGYRR